MPRYSQEFKAQALEMIESGLSYKEVARRMGVSNVMVGQWADPSRKAKAAASTKEWVKSNPEQNKASVKRWKDENKDLVRKKRQEYERENKEKIKIQRAECHARNREKRNAYAAEYRAKNAEKMRKLWSDYTKNNPDKNAAKTAKRRTRQKSVPQPHSIIERMMVENYYEDAARLSKETGTSCHVDHIWPIARGGPHLPWNLQVIPGPENCRKGARLQ